MALTAKQEAFAVAYVETGNAAEAYRRAYDASRMIPASVWRKASELMDNGAVTARVSELQTVAAERAIVSKERVLRELAAIAFGNLDDVAPWDQSGPHLIASAELPAEARSLVQSMKVKREREWRGKGEDAEPWEVESTEIKLHDKLRALDMLMKHLGMAAPDDPGGDDNRKQTMIFANLTTEQIRGLLSGHSGA